MAIDSESEETLDLQSQMLSEIIEGLDATEPINMEGVGIPFGISDSESE